MTTWFPNEEDADMAVFDNGKIAWTIAGASRWSPIFKRYGKTLGQITSFDEFRGIHGSVSEIEIERRLDEMRGEITKSPNTMLSLDYKILLAIMSGNDSDQAKLEAKRKARGMMRLAE